MNIKSAFFPYDHGGNNMYQSNLANALGTAGIEVASMPSKKILPYLQFRNSSIDIIHHFWPHDLYTGKNARTQLLKRLMFRSSLPIISSKRLVYSVENLISHEAKKESEEKKWIQKIVSRGNGFVYMSSSSRKLFREFYDVPPTSSDVIVPHVRYNFANEVDRSTARKMLDIPATAKVLLCLGRINRYKGINELIKTMSQINDKDICLLVVGRCTDEDYWAELSKSSESPKGCKVRLVNAFVDNNDLQKYYNASDAALCNYTDVPMNPGAPVTAMGFGCCIVGPKKGALPEVVPSYGFFGFDPNIEGGIKIAIEKLFSTTDLPERGRQIKNYIETEHSLENVGSKIRDLYERILKR